MCFFNHCYCHNTTSRIMFWQIHVYCSILIKGYPRKHYVVDTDTHTYSRNKMRSKYIDFNQFKFSKYELGWNYFVLEFDLYECNWLIDFECLFWIQAKNGSSRKCFCVLLGRHILYYKTASDKVSHRFSLTSGIIYMYYSRCC